MVQVLGLVPAGVAAVPAGDADLGILALGRFLQGDFHGVAQIIAAIDLATAACACAAEHIAKDVAKSFGETAGTKAAAHATVGVYAGMAVLVIGCALLTVREHLVGLFDLLELLFGFLGFFTLIAVRVVLHGQLAVGLLDFIVRGRLGDAQNFVIVAFGHVMCSRLKQERRASRPS